MVALVGMGPGDPGLLTLRAAAELERADVVVVDRASCHDESLSHCRADVEILDSAEGDPVKLTTRAAKAGKRVVRLFAGDPGLGCGLAAEGGALAKAGIPFEIVPGVSSAVAAPALAGIPVTHRGLASSFATAAFASSNGIVAL